MKEGWEYKTLGEVAKIIHGKNQKDVLSDDGKYPIYGSGGNIMGYSKEYLCTAGTTILGRKGSINNPFFIEENFWNVDTAFGISAKDNYSSKFIFYYCKSKDWNKLNTGTTLPSLTQSVVKSQIIAVPSYDEQRRIVSYLDSSFKLIDEIKNKALKSLTEAKALFQSALSEAMEPKEGWEEKTLGECCDKINGLWKGKKPPFIYVGVIRNANFTKKMTLDFSNIEYLDVEVKQYNSRKLKRGDLIIEKSGGSEKQPVGRAVLFLKGDGEYSFSNFTSVLRIKNNEELNYYFLYYFLLYIYQRGDTKTMQKATTGIHNIEFEKYLNIKIPIMSLNEQRRIVSYLDKLSSKVRAIEEKYQKMVEECDALKQAMLRDVFE